MAKNSSNEVMENLSTSQQLSVTMTNINKRNAPREMIEGKTIKKICPNGYTNAAVENVEGRAIADSLDLCTPEGQLAASKAENPDGNPGMTWDQAKHAARREYNRVNASRARQRNKEVADKRDQQIVSLQSQIDQLTRLNQVLMNYICEIHASSNTQSVASVGTNDSNRLLEALAILSKSGISAPTPAKVDTENDSTLLMSRLKQKQTADDHRDQQHSLAMNHPTQPHDNASLMRHEIPNILNDFLLSQALTEPVSSLIGPITRALQAQQLLTETTKKSNSSYPWNAVSEVYQPVTAAATNQQTTGNSLWDLLLSMQQLHNILPSSGAPKAPHGE